MDEEKEKFKRYLKKRNFKFTPEREIILDEVFTNHEHFDAEGLKERLKEKGYKISRATIYRMIPLLLDSGLIKEAIMYEDRIYYEQIYGNESHEHMVCVKCGKVIEFSGDRIEKIVEEVSGEYGFKPVAHKFGIKGYCKDCR